MISLKKYLDMDPTKNLSADLGKDIKRGPDNDPGISGANPSVDELLAITLEAYQSALLTMGKSSVEAFPALGTELHENLAGLGRRLSTAPTITLVEETEIEVESSLQRWSKSAAEYLKTKTNEIKELIIVIARTAESMATRDRRYTDHFGKLTAQLEAIADLEDLSLVRSSLMKHATELKTYVDRMTQESLKSMAQLQAEVTTYETKLKVVELAASQDVLTGLANRRKIEDRIEFRIAEKMAFCVAILDLERFKQVNDTYGHAAGDNLLQQFSHELKSNSRGTDIVGRWGGDEFIVILDSDLNAAKTQVERLQKWVLGEYTIQLAGGVKQVKVKVDASIGVSQWQPGQTLPKLIASADSVMYIEKGLAKGQKA